MTQEKPLAQETAGQLTKPNVIRQLYDWVLGWASHKYAGWALFAIAFAEASFFPIPPDVLLIAMAVGAPHRALHFALICTIGSVLGGIAGYTMGWGFWNGVDQYFYQYVPGFTEEGFQSISHRFAENTFLTIFTAGFTPIPFKIFTIAAGAVAAPFLLFIIGSAISRGLRFGIVAGLIMWFGPSVKVWIDKYFNILTIVATVLIVLALALFHHYG